MPRRHLALFEMIELVELSRQQGRGIGLEADDAIGQRPRHRGSGGAEPRRMHAADQRKWSGPGVPSGRRPSASITGAKAQGNPVAVSRAPFGSGPF